MDTWQLVWAKAAEQSVDVREHRAAGLVQECQLLQVVSYLLLGHDSAQLRLILEEADDKLLPQWKGCCAVPNAHGSFLLGNSKQDVDGVEDQQGWPCSGLLECK